MKLIFKIALVMMFTIFVNSCQKENNCPMRSKTESTGANQRVGATLETHDGAGSTKSKDAYEKDYLNDDDVVGGGDDDRDGGEKKPKKTN